MNVTTENYCQLAWRTAKQMPPTDMLLHGALGLLTEVSELAEASLVLKTTDYVTKELGDVVWFCNYIHTSRFGGFMPVAFAMPDTQPEAFSRETLQLLVAAGNIGTAIKAYAFYGKELDGDALRGLLQDAVTQVRIMCAGFSVPYEAVLQANIDKLALRYPEKYSDAAAIARGDEAAEPGAGYVDQ